jgi:TRAP-type C4-dicarboxylate transport system permease small subunit
MTRFVYGLRGITRILGVAETILGSLMMFMIFVLMLMQVAQRYLPVGPGVWVGELARFGLVWLTFAVAGYLVSKNEHVAIGVIDTLLKRDLWRRGVIVFVNIVIAAIGFIFTFDALGMVQAATGQVTSAIGIPLRLIYVIPMIGFIMTSVHGVVRALSAIFVPTEVLAGDKEGVTSP